MAKTLLDSRVAVIRALAAGLTIWCLETGEAFQMGDNASLNHARRICRLIIENSDEQRTFYAIHGE